MLYKLNESKKNIFPHLFPTFFSILLIKMSTSSLSETAPLKIDMIDAQYIYSIFQQYMKALADESLNSCNTLANIKTGLEIGKLNEKSDIISVYEMQANANKLLDNVQLNKQKSTEITENIMQIEEIISTEEIVNNSISNKLNCIMHESWKSIRIYHCRCFNCLD